MECLWKHLPNLILYLGLKNGGYRNLWQFQLEKTYSKLSNLGYLRVQVP